MIELHSTERFKVYLLRHTVLLRLLVSASSLLVLTEMVGVHSTSVNTYCTTSARGCRALAMLEEEIRVDSGQDQLLICCHSSSFFIPLDDFLTFLSSPLSPYFLLFESCKLKLYKFFPNVGEFCWYFHWKVH